MTLAVDTSAAVALIMASHVAHRAVRRHLRGRDLVLTQHSLAETYSVLTRLPGDARVAPADAVRLIEANFGPPALMPATTAAPIRTYAPRRWAGEASASTRTDPMPMSMAAPSAGLAVMPE